LNFKFPDNTEIQRKIISEPTSTELTLDSTLGIACTAAELPFLTISFLYFVRFDIDQLAIVYHTDSSASVKATFKTLREFVIE